MKPSLLNPHKEIEASITRIYGFSRDADFGYIGTIAAGTFSGRRGKKIFGYEYMGRDNKAMTLRTVLIISQHKKRNGKVNIC
jgi:hypothetical protein